MVFCRVSCTQACNSLRRRLVRHTSSCTDILDSCNQKYAWIQISVEDKVIPGPLACRLVYCNEFRLVVNIELGGNVVITDMNTSGLVDWLRRALSKMAKVLQSMRVFAHEVNCWPVLLCTQQKNELEWTTCSKLMKTVLNNIQQYCWAWIRCNNTVQYY